jgi:hypothetical protein
LRSSSQNRISRIRQVGCLGAGKTLAWVKCDQSLAKRDQQAIAFDFGWQQMVELLWQLFFLFQQFGGIGRLQKELPA